MTAGNVKLSSLFAPDQVACNLDELTCHEAFHHLIELIYGGCTVDAEDTYQQVLARKSCGIALVPPGVAVIHVRVKGLEQLRMAVGTTSKGIRCAATIEGGACIAAGLSSVKLIIMVLAPLDDPTGYLRCIAALNHACRQEGFVEQVYRQEKPENIWKTFEEANEYLPGYLVARDIMNADFPHLHDTDTLSHAIDAFCRLGVSELPVVDVDGDLIGIAAEVELIRVCLPEYVTWMEDLTPILNFEPFAEILRRESQLPLLEIMQFSERYATVDEESPAIQVAKVMLRRDVRQVYVVRDNNLLGVITIQDFIHKVLRA